MTSEYVIDVPPQTSLPVLDEPGRFPVRRVYCVGRNYGDHAREMGGDPDREPPFFFSKPADAVFAVGDSVPYPPVTEQLEYEVELIVAIGIGGATIDPAEALGHVWGYGIGIDLTRRDLQATAKELRRPWDLSKGFDASGPCSPLVPASRIGHPDRGAIWLSVNGAEHQRGDLADQIWPVADILAELSRSVALGAGDLIFTGTPAGVGPIVRGDRVTAGIEGIAEIAFDID
jgi:fumarylpyruvate hydrolase